MDMMVKLPTRILLIDDHLVVRRGLAELIGSELDCCCTEVANSDECLAALQANSFDLAVLDVSLGQESGFDLVERLNEKEIRIVVYSMFEDAKTIRRALGMGCNAYVSKRESADDLFLGIKHALAAQEYLSPIAACAVASSPRVGADKQEGELSRREVELLDILGRGCSKQEIAETMAIATRTIETYFLRIMGKLSLSNINELRKYAIERRVKDPSEMWRSLVPDQSLEAKSFDASEHGGR